MTQFVIRRKWNTFATPIATLCSLCVIHFDMVTSYKFHIKFHRFLCTMFNVHSLLFHIEATWIKKNISQRNSMLRNQFSLPILSQKNRWNIKIERRNGKMNKKENCCTHWKIVCFRKKEINIRYPCLLGTEIKSKY